MKDFKRPFVVEGRVGNREVLVPIGDGKLKASAATVYYYGEGWDVDALAEVVRAAIDRYLAEQR